MGWIASYIRSVTRLYLKHLSIEESIAQHSLFIRDPPLKMAIDWLIYENWQGYKYFFSVLNESDVSPET
jgi:hypothetical protein